MNHRLPINATLLLLGYSSLVAEFPPLFNSEPDQSAHPPAASTSLAQLQLPPGFQATLFAGEPDVQNPIAMTWDARGRLWVAENFTYAERSQRFELSLRDRVLIFEDFDHDGQADSREVFTDDIQMLTSIEVGEGGIWLMCPPQLLFLPDRDRNDRPDGPPQVVLDGFTVAQNNYHNFANGLRWGPDGWLYGRVGGSCPGLVGVPGTPAEERIPVEGGIWRYHPGHERVEVLCHGTTNPWGHDWDRHGQGFFINTVNGHLWHLIPGAHFKQPFGASPNPLIFDRLDMHADHYHFDTNISWMQSRDGKANSYGGGHAHSGMMIYQGDLWPERFHNRLFTLNMHGFRANTERLERHQSGYVGKHETDLFTTMDSWFRGLDIRQGPNESVFVMDWTDTGECHEHTGVHRKSGRIYQISYGTPKKNQPLSIQQALEHPNVYHERQLRQRIREGFVTRDDISAGLTKTLLAPGKTEIRLRTLWLLHQTKQLTTARLTKLLDDPDEHLQVWAIRLLTEQLPIDTIMGARPSRSSPLLDSPTLRQFVRLAENCDSALVRLALASTLQRLSHTQRTPLASALAKRHEDAHDYNLPKMLWFGIHPLVGTNPSGLNSVARATSWPKLLEWISRSQALGAKTNPKHLETLLRLALEEPAKATPILSGISAAFRGWQQAPQPKNWSQVANHFQRQKSLLPLVRDLSAVFGDGRAIDQLKQVVLNDSNDIGTRSKALDSLIDNNAEGLKEICEKVLGTRNLSKTALRGLVKFSDPEIAANLSRKYRSHFRPQQRPSVIAALVSRATWADQLLEQIAAQNIPTADLSPFYARQIRNFGVEDLTTKLSQIWGDIQETTKEKRTQIDTWKTRLTPQVLSSANLSSGRHIYNLACQGCHRLYGAGGKIGPDLTGSGRSNLDYLLENIVTPSAVVSSEYRMNTITLKDGQQITGIIAHENQQTIGLQTATDSRVVDRSLIKTREASLQSMMPDGLLETLEFQQVRDLIAYLQFPQQVPLPDKRIE